MVRHLELVVRCVVHGSRIAVLGGRCEELGAKYLRFLWHHSMDRYHMAWAAVLLHFGAIELNIWTALVERLPGCGVGAGVLMLELLWVCLLDHVCRWAEVAGLQILVAHDLREGGSADTMQRTHYVMRHGRRLGEVALLAYAWVHPGDPVTLASSAATYRCCTLTVWAGYRKVGETGRVMVKRHTAYVLSGVHPQKVPSAL